MGDDKKDFKPSELFDPEHRVTLLAIIAGLFFTILMISDVKADGLVDEPEPFFGVYSAETLYNNIPKYCTKLFPNGKGNHTRLKCVEVQQKSALKVNNNISSLVIMLGAGAADPEYLFATFKHCIVSGNYDRTTMTIDWMLFHNCIDATIRRGIKAPGNKNTYTVFKYHDKGGGEPRWRI